MIYTTRHGQTEWNALKKVMGNVDIPLNKIGIEQAKAAKNNLKNLKIDLIICSPLLRTKQTAEIFNEELNVPIIFDNRILERSFGEMEGLSINDFDFEGFWDYYKNNKYLKAENIQEFFKRVYNAIEDYKEKYKNKNILLVTHGGVNLAINCFYKKEIPHDTLLKSVPIMKNCELFEYKN